MLHFRYFFLFNLKITAITITMKTNNAEITAKSKFNGLLTIVVSHDAFSFGNSFTAEYIKQPKANKAATPKIDNDIIAAVRFILFLFARFASAICFSLSAAAAASAFARAEGRAESGTISLGSSVNPSR